MTEAAEPTERRGADVKGMLITGATGSLGSELVARYYGDYEVYAQGRDAQKLLKLRMRYPRLNLVLGDLRCHGLHEAIRCCDVVVHAAAQKYVDLAEQHCYYTVDTNVVCTHELADLAARQGVERFVFISTDKSSAPNNVYGITKYLAERLILELCDTYRETDFVVCRFGNIFGSNGSVVRLWLDAMRRPDGSIRVTDPGMTRFIMSLENAVDLVLYAFQNARPGDIFVQKAPACTIGDLAQALLEMFGARNEVKVIGTRHGEKRYETLLNREEMARAEDLGEYFRIPADTRDLNYAKYFVTGEKGISERGDYDSGNTRQLGVKEIRELLARVPYVKGELAR